MANASLPAADRFSEVNLIADPLYGYIEITKGTATQPGERNLLDTPWLQRLRRIHQLQSAWWVFPSAEHSRFVHLLGAMHLASLFARRVDASLRAAFPDAPSPACVEETLRLAGLLHDVGHGPFGHFFDQEVLAQWGIDHEDIGRSLVENELADIIGVAARVAIGRVRRRRARRPALGGVGDGRRRHRRATNHPAGCARASRSSADRRRSTTSTTCAATPTCAASPWARWTCSGSSTTRSSPATPWCCTCTRPARCRCSWRPASTCTRRSTTTAPGGGSTSPCTRSSPTPSACSCPATRWSTATTTCSSTTGRCSRPRSAGCARPPATEERRLGEAWGRLLRRDLHWHLAYETIAHRGIDLSTLQQRLLDAVPEVAATARVQVDVVSAKIAPHNPMADHGFVAMYDPIKGTVERTHTAEMIARLPQHNQLVRVFTDDVDAIPALHRAILELLG